MRLLLSVLFIFTFSLQAYAVTETQIKAVFLEKFTHLIEWPKRSDTANFTICVLNNEDFAKALQNIYINKRLNDKKVDIVLLSDKDEIPACQLLFVGKKTKNIEKVTRISASKAMLTVCDNKEYIDKNIMITMFLSNKRFKYIINNKAAQDADIKISYLLLKSAQEVIK